METINDLNKYLDDMDLVDWKLENLESNEHEHKTTFNEDQEVEIWD